MSSRAGRARVLLTSAVASFLALALSAAKAGTIYVDANASGPAADGLTWCTGFRDLQDGLAAAQAGDEIRVATGVYCPDRASGDRFATFTLKSQVSLRGGYAGCGAADPNARNYTLQSSRLSGDLLENDGPAFANYADNSYHVVTYDDPAAMGVLIEGFTISGGNADGADGLTNQGGGIHIRQGLVKCLPGGPTIRDCIVAKNWAAHHGAINDHGLNTIIENCLIRDNHSEEEGGGLQVHSGSPTITNCTFLNNSSGREGGGAWVGTDTDPTCSGPSTATFTDCTFEGNTAQLGGGMAQKIHTAPTLARCVFRNNTAALPAGRAADNRRGDPGDADGGGVWFRGNEPTFIDCQFIGNSATANGGGTYGAVFFVLGTCGPSGCELEEAFVTTPTFERCLWDGNTGVEGGGHYHGGVNTDTIRLSDCVVRNNYATRDGGGIYVYDGTPIITNTLFENNHADLHGGGAVSYIQFNDPFRELCEPQACEGIYDNCTFRNNTAERGGGLWGAYSARVTLTQVVFEGNDASYSGGGMHMTGINTGLDDPLASRARLSACTFQGNSSDHWAGALAGEGDTTLTVVQCDFLQNTALGQGGAMFSNSRANVFNSRFVGNRTLPESLAGDAGAIYTSGELLLANTLLSGNWSKHNGGAVGVFANAAAQIANCTFSANACVNLGGALLASQNTNVLLVNSVVWDSEDGTGSALFGSSLSVSHSTVEGGWPGVGNLATDPQFVDPDGRDDIPGTQDDDWRLSFNSPSLNAGDASMLPADVADIDGDGDTGEPVPFDLNDELRIFGTGLDMGALETGVILCSPGTFSANGEQPCTPCPAGNAQPAEGATQCEPCAAGTIAPQQGAATCSACPPETFQPALGATACLPCDCDDANVCTTNACNAISGACENETFCQIPAASAWGLTVLSLLLTIAGTLIAPPFPRKSAMRPCSSARSRSEVFMTLSPSSLRVPPAN